MIAEDLRTHELLQIDPDGGEIRFAGQRALLVDAVAMGLLRKYLIESLGLTAARAVLTQFGFAHGWRMAEAIRGQFDWSSDEDWRRAGPRLCTLEGLFRAQTDSMDALTETGAVLDESYEAEQHLVHCGRSETTACWTISGLISGYLSRTQGEETFVLEDRCVARGDPACRFLAKSRARWGRERRADLAFFEANGLEECLNVSLHRVTESLKKTERTLLARRRAIVQVSPDLDTPLGIVAKSPAMRRALDLAQRLAKVDCTVLITGESGAGKERIARLMHEDSVRANRPFIAVNCGAISEPLLESELFGHVRGAFTGASHDRPGLFEAANHGTLLLDEIGDVSPSMQVKLLRVLQEREVRRVGDNKNRAIDVRVLAATNRDLSSRVAAGAFRQDLYYRINVVELHVPALRERQADILDLARMLLAESALRMKRRTMALTPASADQLLRYEWPGNVRELQNAMERAVALTRDNTVELQDLPEEVRHALPRPLVVQQVRPLEVITREYILAALKLNGGNQTQTAEQLRIGSATMHRKLKRYGLTTKRTARP